ncbi:MAG: hypothetical protein KGN76_04795, partial [Acidobacteriota bacterium]|nr:hypothetical protein [Acidobacteriota bacterium]
PATPGATPEGAATPPPVAAGPRPLPLLSGTPIGPTYPPTRYDVYEVPKTEPPAPPWLADVKGDGSVARGPLASPLNPAPLGVTTYTDTRMTWGQERCYVVRARDVYDKLPIDSAPSPMTCVTLKDTFPPAAPTGLQAVASAGAISLIWNPNAEPDLAGYLVLRGLASGGPLAPITPAPVRDTTFRDATVQAGVRYVYAVVAVDTANNRSHPSGEVERTAQ